MSDFKNPIAVFDSGVGGLTVLRELRRRWPGENFLYLADTARLPYGSKSLNTIHQYAQQNIKCLLKYNPKAIVVACNSASTAILAEPLPCPIPLLNVVEPGARKAVELSPGRRIGVLGTRATILSQAYPHAIRRLAPTAEVFQQPCPLWVPLVEEGWLDDPITNLIVYRYVSTLMRNPVDTLILGCTHYPALKPAIQKVVGHAVQLVDSSLGLIEDLEKLGICQDSQSSGRIHILCTDFSPRLEETFRLLLGDLNHNPIETIDLSLA